MDEGGCRFRGKSHAVHLLRDRCGVATHASEISARASRRDRLVHHSRLGRRYQLKVSVEKNPFAVFPVPP